MRFVKIILLILFVGFLIVFVQQNTEMLNTVVQFKLEDPVIFKRAWTTNAAPLLLVVVLSFVMGGLLATLYLFLDKLRLNRLASGYKAQAAGLEREVAALKAQIDREKALAMPTMEAGVDKPVSEG